MVQTFSIIDQAEQLAALRPEWQALWRRATGAYAIESDLWASVSLQIPPDARPRRLLCLCGRDGDRLNLIWPWVVRSSRGFTIGRPLATEWGSYSTALMEADADPSLLRAAWRALRKRSGCDLLDLQFLREGSPLTALLASPWSLKTLVLPAPWIAGGGDWAQYRAAVSATHKSQWSDLQRKRRRLAELGDIAIEQVAASEAAAVVAWIVANKRSWLERSHLDDAVRLDTAEFSRFTTTMLETLIPAGQACLFALKCGGRLIAADIWLIDTQRAAWHVGTFDPEFAKFRSGQLLKEHVIQWAFERRLDVDLQIGAGRHKALWQNRVETVISYRCANSLRGRAYVLARRGLSTLHDQLDGVRRRRRAGQELPAPPAEPSGEPVPG